MRYPYFNFPKPTKQNPFINFYHWLMYFDSKIEEDNTYYNSNSSNTIKREYFEENSFPLGQIINRQNIKFSVSEYERDLYIDLRILLESSLLKVTEKIGLLVENKKQQFILNCKNEILKLEGLLAKTINLINYTSFKIILEDLKYEIEKLSKFISNANFAHEKAIKKRRGKKNVNVECIKIEWMEGITKEKKKILFKLLTEKYKFLDNKIGFFQFDKLFNGELGNGKKIVWDVRNPRNPKEINKRLLLYLLDKLKNGSLIKNFTDDNINNVFCDNNEKPFEYIYHTRKGMDSRKEGNSLYTSVDNLIIAVNSV